MRRIIILVVIGASMGLFACAQVPKESVTLSATVGRDMAEMHRAHRELAVLYYDRMIQDINEFVDEKYVPFQIRETLKKYGNTLIKAIQDGAKPDATGDAQKIVMGYLTIYLEELRNNIEAYRKKLLDPIQKQKEAFLKELEESYRKIHYANSIVTGHLSSVVKVHETQDELLAEVKMEGLRSDIGGSLSEFAAQVTEFLAKARKSDETVSKLSENLETIVRKYTADDK